MKRKALFTSFVFAALVAIAIIFSLLVPQSPPAPIRPPPNPNGFDTLLRASQLLAPGTSDFSKLDEITLAAIVDSNSNALQIARIGTQQEFLLPMESGDALTHAHAAFLPSSKQLACAFAAEGRLAEIQHRNADSSKSYLDVVRLGVQLDRGGLPIDGLAALAVESIGTSNLRRLSTQLDSNACRETAETLEELDASREPWSKIIQQQEAYLQRSAFSLRERALLILNSRSRKKSEERSELMINERILQTRCLILDLAARAYELDKGHRPTSASDLVPDYLKAIPQDPTTGTNLTLIPWLHRHDTHSAPCRFRLRRLP